MSTEFLRLILISIPSLIINLLNSFIILGEDVRMHWRRILSFGLITGFLTWIMYMTISPDSIRSLLSIVISYVVLKFTFKFEWWSAVKIFIILLLFEFIVEVFAILIGISLFNITVEQIANDVSIWLKVLLPCYFLSILFAYLISKVRYPLLSFFAKIKKLLPYYRFRLIYFASIANVAILSALIVDYIMVTVNTNPLRIITAILAFFALLGLNIYLLYESIKITEEKMVSEAADIISSNTNELITTLRSQRHDFANHLQILYTMSQLEKHEELQQYLSQLVKDTSSVNEVIKLGDPFIGGLINTKIAQASLKDINLRVEVRTSLYNLSTKALDLTRILGNLIDNAFDAVETANKKDKWAKIIFEEIDSFLIITVSNPGAPSQTARENMFSPGFTTKGESHSGLGLHICCQLAQKHNGNLEYINKSEDFTQFKLKIPKQ